MSTSSPSQTRVVTPQSSHSDRGADFVRWALAQLKLDLDEQDGVVRLRLSEADQSTFDGRDELMLEVADETSAGVDLPEATVESLGWDGRFGRWLIERIKSSGPAWHARPWGEPMSVGDIMTRMFAAYDVDGGNTHLAGCELTDHPFVRLSFAAADNSRVNHIYVAPDGSTVSDALVEQLGLDKVESISDAPPRLSDSALRSLVGAGLRIAAKRSSNRDPDATVVDPLAVTIIWIRHADGRLQFTIGEASATLDFSGWAKLLVPPPFVARGSGASTFHLAATDDGRIDAAEAISACQQSGRRVLTQELVRCAVTGQHVLRDFTETCPVTGLPALRSEFAECPHCRQRVSKAAIGPFDAQDAKRGDDASKAGRCQACRQLAKIRKDDPRLVWLLGEHPGLDRWNRWQLAETESVYIGLATSLTKRLLAVVDKENLAVHFLATGGILNSGWAEVTGGARDELLR